MDRSVSVQALMAKARSKLKTAQIDFDAGQYDDAVSRAYYAVHSAISAVLLDKGLAFSSHGQVIGAFNREFIKPGKLPKDFAAFLQELFDARQESDYDPLPEINIDSARVHLANAKAIISAIESCLN